MLFSMVSFSFARGNTAVRFLLIKTNHKVKYFGILERAFCMENMQKSDDINR